MRKPRSGSLLATVSVSRLREAGMLDSLLQLARPGGGQQDTNAGDDSIDTMDVDDLVQAALSGQTGPSDPPDLSRN